MSYYCELADLQNSQSTIYILDDGHLDDVCINNETMQVLSFEITGHRVTCLLVTG